MAKKQPQIRKNSRASRRQELEDVTAELNPSGAADTSGKDQVLQQLAEKKLREGAVGSRIEPMGIDEELTAISQGVHPVQKAGSGARVLKGQKNSKKKKQKRERAEMHKDMLSEKVQLAKKRHKTVRAYREEEKNE